MRMSAFTSYTCRRFVYAWASLFSVSDFLTMETLVSLNVESPRSNLYIRATYYNFPSSQIFSNDSLLVINVLIVLSGSSVSSIPLVKESFGKLDFICSAHSIESVLMTNSFFWFMLALAMKPGRHLLGSLSRFR
ncbi:hypothetical protein BpHYR1_033478 [Brachionus plicatilis]|uniref:Uncharacterized protein n=1 Tax=Brachionus plicatilis TaxID=10195 RepID=A0A3M7QWR5_BRAPC|nr:hypothetical protein BpHYR1_033478 [Brachionus plicatilis]